eukprot:NODE_14562_length_1101_cov_4.530801.p7 GENE.NODE_14562_length_1101_cov_4.530801~~NODE_14562_length_1101_cov_4.530801.p7  ORF type:complete len:68 (-),score=8.08 NODE_14562_length_1101_cov_4.530801:162-365(-)
MRNVASHSMRTSSLVAAKKWHSAWWLKGFGAPSEIAHAGLPHWFINGCFAGMDVGLGMPSCDGYCCA